MRALALKCLITLLLFLGAEAQQSADDRDMNQLMQEQKKLMDQYGAVNALNPVAQQPAGASAASGATSGAVSGTVPGADLTVPTNPFADQPMFKAAAEMMKDPRMARTMDALSTST